MSLTLKRASNSEKIELTKISFDEEFSEFSVTSEDGSNQIIFKYQPQLNREFEDKDFQVFFLSNKYLDAENDIFELYEKDWNCRIGWIFPLHVLESNENEFADNIYLNRYKFPVFKELLMKRPHKEVIFNNPEYKLSDFFEDNAIILVISTETIPENKEFHIDSYLPSLANHSYYLWNNHYHHYYELKEPIILSKRGDAKIFINKSKLNISDDQFLEDLYKTHLKSINHFLLKFYFLYQVFEYLLDVNFNSEFDKWLEEYKVERLSKNDLKEMINNISKERIGVKRLIEKSTISQDLTVDINRDCKLLLEDFYSPDKIKSNTADLIYDVRNLVVHRFREISKRENATLALEKITHQMELLVNQIIITYKD